jgi:hypothetical protein
MIRGKIFIGTAIIASVVITGCDGQPSSSPTAPSAPATIAANHSGAPASSWRSGALQVTKECSAYTGLAGSFCTITSSNLKGIEVGSRVVYAKAAGASLDSDVILDPPGPGNNTAFGHCALDFATARGLCTFSGGTGKFTRFHATVAVSHLGEPGGPNWAWDGTYSFGDRGDDRCENDDLDDDDDDGDNDAEDADEP